MNAELVTNTKKLMKDVLDLLKSELSEGRNPAPAFFLIYDSPDETPKVEAWHPDFTDAESKSKSTSIANARFISQEDCIALITFYDATCKKISLDDPSDLIISDSLVAVATFKGSVETPFIISYPYKMEDGKPIFSEPIETDGHLFHNGESEAPKDTTIH